MKKKIEIKKKKRPCISVIIPVYKDPSGIRDTLNSLVKQDFPNDDFEVIVVDNGSTDNTPAVVKDFVTNYPKIIRFLVEDKIQSSYAARNKGIEASRGDIIAFIDADMSVDEDWLSRIHRTLEKYNAKYLACNVKIYSEKNSISGFYDVMTGFPIEGYVKELHFSPTCCLAVNKEIFDKLGLFDNRLISSGDYEFGNRVHRAGYDLHYESNIVMRHPARNSLKSLLKKAFRIGRGNYQITDMYPGEYPKKSMNILNPLGYLPVFPWKFIASMKGNKIWNDSSFTQKVAYYLIHWITTFTGKFGYIYERL